jgi:hypothetical protein
MCSCKQEVTLLLSLTYEYIDGCVSGHVTHAFRAVMCCGHRLTRTSMSIFNYHIRKTLQTYKPHWCSRPYTFFFEKQSSGMDMDM